MPPVPPVPPAPRSLDQARGIIRTLEGQTRSLVQLLSLFHVPTPRSDIAAALGSLGYRAGTRALTGADILPSLDRLSQQGIVENDPSFTLARDLAHAATLAAVEGGSFASMVAAVRRIRPAKDPSTQALRFALYASRWAEARPLAAALGPGAFDEICRPFDHAWVAALPPDLRLYALRAVLLASTATLEPADEALAMLRAAPELDDHAHRVLVEQMVLRGDLDEAERLLAGRSSIEADVGRAQVLFLRGHRAEAVAAYGAALRRYLGRAGKRARFFPERAGVFFVAALLDEDRAESTARAKALADAAKAPGISGVTDAYDVLSEVAAVRSGEREPEHLLHVGQRRFRTAPDPLEILLRVLAAGWVGAHVEPELLRDLEKQVACADAAGYFWLAGQGAEALARHGRAGNLGKLRKPFAGVRLAALLARPDPWSRALEALLEIGAARAAKVSPAMAAEHDRRLVWVVAGNEHWLSVEPREQLRKPGGFTKGRPVALKRLRDEAAEMSFLRPEDREAILAIEERVTTSYYGRYRDVDYAIDAPRAFRALVGHPAVLAEDPKIAGELVPAEVRSGAARLCVERRADGLHIALDPAPKSNEETAVVRRVGDTTFEVVDFSPAHHAIARAIGRKGIVVPSTADARVRAVLAALSGVVDVHAEIDEPEAAPGDPRPVVVLRELGDGISAEIVVRPFGALGPGAQPGRGGTTMLAELGGERRKAARDLAEEARRLDEALAACSVLAAAERTGAGFAIRDRDRALEAVVELRALGDRVRVEWPEGEALRVTDELTLDEGRFTVRSHDDELYVEGDLVLPGGRRVPIAELFGYLATSPGRFLKLAGDPWYLALHRDLRARLGELGGLVSGKRPRLPALLAPVLDELLAGARVEADEGFRRTLESWSPRGDPDVPKTFRGDLRPYQRDGYRWLARLGRIGAGACLADDMGLGKTVQTLALLVHRAPEGPSLVVAPTSVVPGWIDEAGRFAPTLRVRAFTGQDRGKLLADLGPFDLVVTSYAILQQDVEQIAAIPWVVAVLDEAQAIKNADTLRARAAAKLRARQRVATTGTPVENRLSDLHGIFRFLAPSLLGSTETFAARFAKPIERDADGAARSRLRRVVEPFILRRTKTDVLPELPARTDVTLRVPLAKGEVALYEAVRAEALESLAGIGAAAGRRRLQILAAITRLRRVASHSRLVLPEAPLAGAKLTAFGELLDEILPAGHRVLVFSQFVDHLTLVRAFLDERAVTYQLLEGSTPPAQRRAAIEAFQAGRADVFLISLRAGGFGLNLTAADYVVHLDPWWNPAVEDQASDRAHRIGQTRPVTVYRLVACDTIEDQILALHHKKRELAESLIEGGEAAAHLTEEDLLAMVRAPGPAVEVAAPERKTAKQRRS